MIQTQAFNVARILLKKPCWVASTHGEPKRFAVGTFEGVRPITKGTGSSWAEAFADARKKVAA